MKTWQLLLGVRHGHRLTFLCAAFTRIGATLAMIPVVFAAFLSAGSADLGAQPAELLGELRIARHELRSQDADVTAIPVQANATFHHLDLILLQTCRRAVFAFLCALQARFDATSIFLVSHIIPSLLSFKGRGMLAYFNQLIPTGC